VALPFAEYMGPCLRGEGLEKDPFLVARLVLQANSGAKKMLSPEPNMNTHETKSAPSVGLLCKARLLSKHIALLSRYFKAYSVHLLNVLLF
jgi:hypothetical protein